MQPIELLCEIVAQKGKVAAYRYSRNPWLSALLAQGFLEKAGVVQSLPCLNCEALHDAEIVHHAGRNGLLCPDTGFVPVSDSEIVAVRANVPRMTDVLANALECRARKSSPIAGETWRVGRVSSEAGDIAIYVHPSMTAERDAANLSAALAKEPGSTYRLILSGAGMLQVAGTKTVPMSEAVELDPVGLEFRMLADVRDLVGAMRTNPGGAPNRFGEFLEGLIRKRIDEGTALTGRNKEADAVLNEFLRNKPGERPPSVSRVREYVSKVRAGR